MSSLSSLLNPPSTSRDSKIAVEDTKTKIMAPDPIMTSDSNNNVIETAASTKKESKRKRKFFLKDGQKDPEPRDNKNYQTLLINSRSRHLKKNDGEPYWRNEIQFEFLMRLFFNYKRVFKNPYFDTSEGFDWPDHFKSFKDENGNLCQNDGEYLTFFELYLITLLKSSKISKILKARLMLDINYALNFSIICLLVNIGRLNTTVNFDHEMKSQFRTYHSIPSLQVGNHLQIIERYYQIQESSQKLFNDEETATNNNSNMSDDAESLKDENINSNSSIRGGSGYTMTTVKQLQDTPRIKSILKSINDLNTVIPKSFKEFIMGTSDDNKFDLNIISLTFLLCVHEFDIGRSFFPNAVQLSTTELSELKSQNKPISTGSLFNDIWLRPDFKPIDKVNRFLWLIYLFKETNFQIDKLIKNPFNKEDQLFHLYSLNSDANLAAEITSENHFLTHKARQVIPDLRFQDSNEPIDPLVNDFDTPDEVEFAGHMKRLRTEFVDFENQGRDDSKKDEYYEYVDETDESENNDHQQQAHSEQDQLNLQQTLLQPQPILASFSQNYSQTEDYKFNSNSNSNSHSHSTEVFNSYDNSNTLSPVLENAINAATCNTAFKKRKSRLTTVEAGAADPLSLLQYDEANNGTNKKKKRMKKPVIELPIRLNTKELENLLNSEIKSINSNSKNAVMKRQRNRIVGEFLMDMFNYKITKFRNLRLKEGNWKNWILNGQHDMNLLIERDAIDNENIVNEHENFTEDKETEDTELKSKFNYGNFGEFKITLFKAFTKINNVINAREIILKSEREEKDEPKDSDFLDDLFSKI